MNIFKYIEKEDTFIKKTRKNIKMLTEPIFGWWAFSYTFNLPIKSTFLIKSRWRWRKFSHFLKSRHIMRKYALIRHKQWIIYILFLNTMIWPFDLDLTTKDSKSPNIYLDLLGRSRTCLYCGIGLKEQYTRGNSLYFTLSAQRHVCSCFLSPSIY